MASSKGKEVVDAAPIEIWRTSASSDDQPIISAVVLPRSRRWWYHQPANGQLDYGDSAITLSSVHGDLEGRSARQYSLTDNWRSIKQWRNHVLPNLIVGSQFSLIKMQHEYFGGKFVEIKGKVISSANKAEEGIVLLDAGDDGLVLLKTPKLNDFLPRVSAALLLAAKCLSCAMGRTHRIIGSSIFYSSSYSMPPIALPPLCVSLV